MIAIGIDVGGTSIKGAFINEKGEILDRFSMKVDKNLPAKETIGQLCELVNEGIKKNNFKVEGIGVGIPGTLDMDKGIVISSPNLPTWSNFSFAQFMKEKTGLPVIINNDANVAALGEAKFGSGSKYQNSLMITLGTGVGSGIVIDGKVVYGHDGHAGELGHTTVVRGENGRLCGCGKTGCLEAYASATGVARTAREILETTDKKSLLRDLKADAITSKDVYDAAVQEDEVALEIFETTGKYLGEKFADFITFSAPEAIVIFGGLTKAGDYLMNPIREHMEKNVMPRWKGKVKLLFSDLKEADAAVLGASALAWE